MRSALTEAELRSAFPKGERVRKVPPGTYITPEARRYAAAQGITLEEETESRPYVRMPMSSAPGAAGFTDAATGKKILEKPEHMTHLAGNRLVEKTHPRILLRGKLDLLQAETVCLQVAAQKLGKEQLAEWLQEVLLLLRAVLATEVKEQALERFTLFGLSEKELHRCSHHPAEWGGEDHPTPDRRMGEIAAALNRLRAMAREAELAAVTAFPGGERPDLILALNRLSSAIYLLYCREVKEHG